MYDQIRALPDHPYHAYAHAMENERQAREHTDQTRIALLARDCGNVCALSWSTVQGTDTDGVPCGPEITLHLRNGHVLVFSNTIEPIALAAVDWRGVSYQHSSIRYRVYQTPKKNWDGDMNAAALAMVVDVTGIPAEHLERFLWLAHQHVHAHHFDRDDIVHFIRPDPSS